MANVSISDRDLPSSPRFTTDINNLNNSSLIEVTVVQKSTIPTTNNPDLLEAQTLFFPRRPRSGHRIPATGNKNKFIFEVEGNDGCSKEMMIAKHEDKRHMKEVKVKYGWIDETKRELEGPSVIFVKGEEVDLNFLARVADGAYERELASMTERMSRAQLIGFMESLQGEWCGRSQRRKVVDAAEFVKALPIDWKIELALRRRAGLPSIHCRSYVSPSGKHFNSCKDAATYLKNQSLTDVATEEGQMRQIKNGFHTFPTFEEVNGVADSCVVEEEEEEDVDWSTTGELYEVKVSTLIECSPCGVVFQDMRGLERHLATFHKETTRRFDLPTGTHTLEKHADMDLDNEPYAQQNGQGSSSSQKTPEPQDEEPVHIINERFKTNCTWCNKEFICEPIDTETMADASGFMCQPCKDKLCGAFERSLLKSYKH